MKECNKFIDSLILYYNPPDYNSLTDYNSSDLISAEEVGIRKGWKAALRWVLKNRKPYYDLEDKKVVATNSDILYKELEEKYYVT